MKRLSILSQLFFVVALFFTSCQSRQVYTVDPEDRAKVDSIVYSNRNIDSLVVWEARFSNEGNLYGQVVVCRELGRSYRNSTRYQEAIDIHIKGLEAAKEICDTLQIVQAFNNIGTAYRRMGALEDAALWHYQGLTWCDKWTDTTSVGLKNRVVSLNGLGNVYLSMGRDSLAMASFREALKGETALGSETGKAVNYANIGALFEDAGMVDSASFYYSRSLESNIKAGSDLGISLCHGHFGRLAEKAGDYVTAFEEYKTAYDMLSVSDDKWHWLESCTSLGRVSLMLKKHSEAGEYLNEALSVAENLGSDGHLADIYNLYYSMSRESGRYGESLRWLEKYVGCVERLYSERNKDAVFELRSEYEREKSRNEIRLMQEKHEQKVRRDKQFLVSSMAFLALSILSIIFLVNLLRLRSRNNRILRELDQTKNNYFTNIAHEFRTPLTVIMSAANCIRRNAETESLRSDAADIVTQSEELLTLVNQVLGIARMKSSIAPDPIWRRGNIAAFVYGVCERSSRLAQSHGVELIYEGEKDLEMDFIPDYVVHVVQNLLSNAIKFSEKGSSVYLRLVRAVSDERLVARISVKDWGLGISEEQMKCIFEPFYQTEGPKNMLGTGIGLSLVKLSVEAMGGTVRVESSPENGTEFTVELPILSKVASKTDFKQVHADDTDAFTILIVEDNPDVARWQMRQLEGDFKFIFAENGQDGLNMAEKHIPDLIITDVMMPVMDGLQMCKLIRESELLCHIPIVMVTAKAMHEDKIRGLEAGADAYLEKPYDASELLLRVNNLLERREVMRRYYSSDSMTDEGTMAPKLSASESAFMEKFDAALVTAFETGHVDCEDIAASLCVGRVQLNRKMKAITGLKTTEYILHVRISKAKHLLSTTDLSVGEIALQCGVEDVGYFSTLFKKNVGMTPTAYRSLV